MWEYIATVRKIVDADTFDLEIDLGFGVLKKERIRLAGVDAWEVRGEEREKGLVAKAFVENCIPVGSVVTVLTMQEKGKYGRYIAEVTYGDASRGKVNLSRELVDEGHARWVEYK